MRKVVSVRQGVILEDRATRTVDRISERVARHEVPP